MTTTSPCRSGDSTGRSDADRGHFLDPGARHGGDGAHPSGASAEVGEEMEDSWASGTRRKTVVTGSGDVQEACWNEGRAGDNVGLLSAGIDKEEVERGQVITPSRARLRRHKRFMGSVVTLSKEEGGAATPFFKRLPAAVLTCGRRTWTGVAKAAGRAWRW